MFVRSLGFTFSIFSTLCWLGSSCGYAGDGDPHLVTISLQGDEPRLSRDFRVELDEGKLRVTLAREGAVGGGAKRELVVALIQEGKPRQEQKIAAGDIIEFENVKAGLSTLVVLGADSLASAKSFTYAAFAFFAEERAKQVPVGLLPQPPEPLTVPVARLSGSELFDQLASVRTDDVGGTMPAQAYESRKRHYFRIVRQLDGSLVGRVQVPQQGLEVLPGKVEIHLFRNDRLVAKTTTMQDGSFRIDRVELGFYSLYAVGPGGHAAYAFEVVEGKPVFNRRRDDQRQWQVANRQAAGASSLEVLLIPPALMAQVKDFVQSNRPDRDESGGGGGFAAAGDGEGNAAPGAAAGGGAAGGLGGFPGGSFSGGGAGGGGFGGAAGAGLAGAAALAAAAVAASNSQSDGFNVNLATSITP